MSGVMKEKLNSFSEMKQIDRAESKFQEAKFEKSKFQGAKLRTEINPVSESRNGGNDSEAVTGLSAKQFQERESYQQR